jgi:Putative sensor
MTTILARAGRDTAYLTIGLLTSILAFGVWVAGLTASVTLAVFIVGLPMILAAAIAFRWTVELDRRNAALVRGSSLSARYRDHHGQRFVARLRSTLADGQTWKDLAWLVAHSVTGSGFGVAAVTLVATVLGTAVLPAWYWAIPDGIDLGLWTVDTLPEAAATALLAIPAGLITIGLLRAMAAGESALAAALLGGGQDETS